MRISAATIICLSIMLTGCTFQYKDEEEHTSTLEYTDIETEEILSTETHSEESDSSSPAAADMSSIFLENPGAGYYLAEEPETV